MGYLSFGHSDSCGEDECVSGKVERLVKVRNVSKKFCRNLKHSLWYGMKDLTSELMGRMNAQRDLRNEEFWAVKDVSFDLKRGECLGLIGRNGAGKSTILKMLGGLIKPDTGEITCRGGVGALIELGAGFNPVLTGRENIYINASVLGMAKSEIDERLQSIIDFAEVGDFIDAPVQSYSSGMKVRLGFAVASQMAPDILLIDEVLAVGDTGFRYKCQNCIKDLLGNTGVIFVSHTMPQVASICDRVLLLDHGEVKMDAATQLAIDGYNSLFDCQRSHLEYGTGDAEVIELSINGEECIGKEIDVGFGNAFRVDAKVKLSKKIKTPVFNVYFHDLALNQTAHGRSPMGRIFNNTNKYLNITCEIPGLFLNPNRWQFSFAVYDGDTKKNILTLLYICKVIVKGKDRVNAPLQLAGHWFCND